MNESKLETLYQGKYLQMVRQGRWEYVERVRVTGVVGIVAMTEQRKVILTEQFRIPIGKTAIELPAGLAGDIVGAELEDLTEAARRELLEETGYDATHFELLTIGPTSAGLTNELIHLYLATGLHRVSDGGGDESEEIIVHEIPLDALPAWLLGKTAEGCLIDTKVFAAMYFLGATRKPA